MYGTRVEFFAAPGKAAEFEARSDQRGLDGGAAEVDADDRQRGGIGHGGG